MSRKVEKKKLPSGKMIYRHFNASGAMTAETQSYVDVNGRRIIARVAWFENGRKVSEAYAADRVISRDAYEELRRTYSDMPPADTSVTDKSAEEIDRRARERGEEEASAQRLGLEPSRLTPDDLFCARLMDRGGYARAADWIQHPGRTLGDLDQAQSRGLIAELAQLGAVATYACNIDPEDDEPASTRDVVVELPIESPARAALFAEVGRLVEEQGFDGYEDRGQRYLYLRLG